MTERLYTNNVHPSSLLQQLSDLWRSNQLCDAVITVDSIIVAKAHKLVLFAVSPKLKSDANYPTSSPFLDVKLPSGIKHRAVHLFLQYLYEGFLLLTTDIAFDMLEIAKFLQISSLLNCCNSFLKSVNSAGISSCDSITDSKLNKVVCEQSYIRWTTLKRNDTPAKRSYSGPHSNSTNVKRPRQDRDVHSLKSTQTPLHSKTAVGNNIQANNKTHSASSGFIFTANNNSAPYTIEDSNDENTEEITVTVDGEECTGDSNKSSLSCSESQNTNISAKNSHETDSWDENSTVLANVKKERTEKINDEQELDVGREDHTVVEETNSELDDSSGQNMRIVTDNIATEETPQRRDVQVMIKSETEDFLITKIKEEPSDLDEQGPFEDSFGNTWFPSNPQSIPLVDDQEEMMATSSTNVDFMTQTVNQSSGQPRRHSNLYSVTAGTSADLSSNFDDSSGNPGLDDSIQSQDGANVEKVKRRYRCTHCGATFTHGTTYQRHVDKHIGISYGCEECGKSFSRKDRLKEHIQRHQRKKYNWQNDQ